LAEAAQASATHLETFARLERWAERTAGSDVRLHGKSALTEATFAPFRSDPDVLWAELRTDQETLAYKQPIASAELHYVPIDAPTVGRLWVALARDCRGGQAREVADACVVLARPDQAPGGNQLRVAFKP
jgi:hypothetical protein